MCETHRISHIGKQTTISPLLLPKCPIYVPPSLLLEQNNNRSWSSEKYYTTTNKQTNKQTTTAPPPLWLWGNNNTSFLILLLLFWESSIGCSFFLLWFSDNKNIVTTFVIHLHPYERFLLLGGHKCVVTSGLLPNERRTTNKHAPLLTSPHRLLSHSRSHHFLLHPPLPPLSCIHHRHCG